METFMEILHWISDDRLKEAYRELFHHVELTDNANVADLVLYNMAVGEMDRRGLKQIQLGGVHTVGVVFCE